MVHLLRYQNNKQGPGIISQGLNKALGDQVFDLAELGEICSLLTRLKHRDEIGVNQSSHNY